MLCTQYKNYKSVLITTTKCNEKYKTDWKIENKTYQFRTGISREACLSIRRTRNDISKYHSKSLLALYILHEVWALALPFVQKIDHHREIIAMIALFGERVTVIDSYFSV